ncbi:MAG TPA: PQQ-dependent sugar dehydrogenase, partial [Candidatus Limnocylindria bacterium]|nr:PQQ-dependent sugar dehydrogenase [Candidatus Limnocylindria bacterium]
MPGDTPGDVPASTPDRPTLDHPDGGIGDDPSAAAIVPGDPIPDGFVEEVVFQGLTQPTVLAFAPDGRVFVGLKEGRVLVYDDLDDPTGSTYADLRTNTHDYWDRGLLGMALDPNFAANGRMYVAYTYNAPPGETAPRWSDGTCRTPPNGPGGNLDGCVVTSRLSVLTNGTNEQVLIHDWCQQFPSHSASDIVFDNEGALIVGGGDGASFSNADYGQFGGSEGSPTPKNPCDDPPEGIGGTQTIPTAEGGALRSQDVRGTAFDDPVGLSGSVIRVNRMTGEPMPDNPGIGASDVNEQRIIAYGLRNPFRMAIQPIGNELWLGEVGWNTWEEIDRHTNVDGVVRNYGWPCREGASGHPSGYGNLDLCTSLLDWTGPHFTYAHSAETVTGDGCETGGGSVSGITFYAGGNYPAEYHGALFWADYTRDCMWVMPALPNGVPDPNAVSLFARLEDPVHLTVGPGGDLFYVDIGESSGDGSVRRIRFLGDNAAPEAHISATPTAGDLPLNVSFSAAGSRDPDDDPLTYAWDFGDDDGLFNDATGATPNHSYTEAGTYTARVHVSDPDGATGVASILINAGNEPPVASITQPSASLTWSVGDSIAFSGTATDPDGSVPIANFTWQLVMEHCPAACHDHVIGTWSGVKSGTFEAPDHEYPSHLSLRLHVEDGDGASDDTEIALQPKTVTVNVQSDPPGITLSSGWVSDEAPFAMTVIRGSAIQLTAPAGATIGGFPFTFESWSDGGGRSHTITPLTSTTVTATFSGGYTDVPIGHPFFNDIGWLVENGITGGCATNPPRYCSSSAVTRAQMASFLVRALDLPPSATDAFTDDETTVHEADINALAAAGITGGCGPDRFCPTRAVTRAEMASFLVRAFDLPPSDTDAFTDDDGSIHEPNIDAIAAAHITGGCSATRYCP